MAAAVLGDVGDARARRPRAGESMRTRLPRSEDLAAVGRRQPEEDARQLRPPRADEPGQAEDLARADASD